MVLFTIRHATGPITFERIAHEFGLSPREIGHDPALIKVSDDNHECVVRLPEQAATKLKSRGEWQVEGPFADAPVGLAGGISHVLAAPLSRALGWFRARVR